MALEAGDFIPDLNANNPLGSDPKSEGDDHLRLVKRCTQGSFPAFVGTLASPKSVSLTEDQINDAALKSEVNAFTAVNTFGDRVDINSLLRLANLIKIVGRNAALTDTLDLIFLDASDRMIVGDDARVFSAIYHAESHRFLGIDGDSFSSTTKAAGSLLVRDRLDLTKKAGFRNPTEVGGATTQTLTQDQEGRVVNFGSGGTVTMDSLETGTLITLTNRGGGMTLQEGTANIRWLNGDGVNHTGNRSVQTSSVVQCYWRAATAVEIWGNGIS